jgi:hypothetical protein
MVGTARYCVLDRGVTLGLSGVNPVHRHVVAQHSRFKSCPSLQNISCEISRGGHNYEANEPNLKQLQGY